MKVLAVVAHPDDMECYCAGTLLKCAERGDEVLVCHVLNGALGHVSIARDELIKIREQEEQNSAKIGGFKSISLNIDDLNLYDNKENRDKIVKIIKDFSPDFIITHHPEDYMVDHNTVSKLVFDASFAATLPQYDVGKGTAAKCVPVFFMETDCGINFNPVFYVDISNCMDKKVSMLKCHKSQYEWLRNHDGIDLSEQVLTISRFRGYQSGVKYAEAFTQCRVNLKMCCKRLLP